MTSRKNLLTDFVAFQDPIEVAAAKTRMFVSAVGADSFTGTFKISSGKFRRVELRNAFLIPEITKNFLLVPAITKNCDKVTFSKENVKIINHLGTVATNNFHDGLFILNPLSVDYANSASRSQNIPS